MSVRKSNERASAATGTGGEGAQLARLISLRLTPEAPFEHVLTVHERVHAALWLQLAPLMGHSGAQTIFARAIQVARRHAPLAATVQIAATGLDFTAVRAAATCDEEAARLHDALTAIAVAVEGLIASLLGPGLSRSLLRDVELALVRQDQAEQDAHPDEGAGGEGTQE